MTINARGRAARRVQFPTVAAALAAAQSWVEEDLLTNRAMPLDRYSLVVPSSVVVGTYDVFTVTDDELTGDKIHLFIQLLLGLRVVAAVYDHVEHTGGASVSIYHPDLMVETLRVTVTEPTRSVRTDPIGAARHIHEGLDFPATEAGWKYAVAHGVWSPMLETPPG